MASRHLNADILEFSCVSLEPSSLPWRHRSTLNTDIPPVLNLAESNAYLHFIAHLEENQLRAYLTSKGFAQQTSSYVAFRKNHHMEGFYGFFFKLFELISGGRPFSSSHLFMSAGRKFRHFYSCREKQPECEYLVKGASTSLLALCH